MMKKYNGKYLKMVLLFLKISQIRRKFESVEMFLNGRTTLPFKIVKKYYETESYNYRHELRRKIYSYKYASNYNGFVNKKGFKYFNKRCILYKNRYNRRIKSAGLNYKKHIYRIDVQRYTNRTRKQHHIENIELVDKHNFNLDHIFSIMRGFELKVSPKLIGDIRNLMVIPKIDNIKKGMDVDYNHVDKELFKDYL